MLKCSPDMSPPAGRDLSVAKMQHWMPRAHSKYVGSGCARVGLSSAEGARLAALYLAIGLLHGGGWELYLYLYSTLSGPRWSRLCRLVRSSWQMYSAGLLFGLFASGMSPVDTTSAPAMAFQGYSGDFSIVRDQQAPLPSYGVCGCKFRPQEVACGSLPKECR